MRLSTGELSLFDSVLESGRNTSEIKPYWFIISGWLQGAVSTSGSFYWYSVGGCVAEFVSWTAAGV